MKLQSSRITIFFLVVIFLSIFSLHVEAANTRRYNDLEWIYYAIAFNSGNPEMCYKISPNALDALYFSPAHLSSEYLRSECFFNVAVVSHNQSLCGEVKAMSSAGSYNYSEGNCIKAVTNNEDVGDGATFDVNILLKEMGVAKEELIKSGVSENDIDLLYLFNGKVNMPTWFKEKLNSLPDFSKEN